MAPRSSAIWSARARNHAKVRYLLSATWGRDHIDPGVWERLVIAVSPGPVMDGDARTPAAALHDKILNEAGVGALAGRADGLSLHAAPNPLSPRV